MEAVCAHHHPNGVNPPVVCAHQRSTDIHLLALQSFDRQDVFDL
jgi:hypothetical protein